MMHIFRFRFNQVLVKDRSYLCNKYTWREILTQFSSVGVHKLLRVSAALLHRMNIVEFGRGTRAPGDGLHGRCAKQKTL